MAHNLNIIGNCPYCRRDVNEDLRPINRSRVQSRESMVDAVSGSSVAKAPSGQSSANLLISEEPAANLTDNLLEMLRHEFERSPDEPSQMTADHADVLVAILKEEDYRYLGSTGNRRKRMPKYARRTMH